MKHRRTFLRIGLLVLFLIIGIQTQVCATQQYRVKKGDTLGNIAKKYGVSVASLKNINHLPGNALALKQVLVIPSVKSTSTKNKKVLSTPAAKNTIVYYRVHKGDTLAKISRRQGVSVADLKAMNHLRGTALTVGRKLIIGRKTMPESVAKLEHDGTVPDAPDVKSLEEDLAPLSDQEWEEIDQDRNVNGEFLGKWRSPKERQLLVKVALGFIGAPYRSGGDTVRGLDSSGFVQKIYEIFDVTLPRTALEQSRVGKRVDRTDLQEGDLVFFHGQKSGGIVGIYIGNNKFVHAAADGNREVRIADLSEPSLDKHFIKAVRLKNLAGG